MPKVLLIEDDPDIVQLLKIHLADLSCEVTTELNGLSGYQMSISEEFDLIILDIMLPDMDGIDICRKVRAKEISTPILMLTAKSEEIDKVLGLEIGADDYMTKPFSIREFIARVKAILRRSKLIKEGLENNKGCMTFDDLEIDVEMRKVTLGTNKIELSPKEFELLVTLASNPGRSFNRSRLLALVWGYDFDGYQHTVNSHINRLRSKIEPDMNNPKFIMTTWGVGYKFNEDI